MNFLTMMFLQKTLSPKKKTAPTKKPTIPQVKTYTAEQFIRKKMDEPGKVGRLR